MQGFVRHARATHECRYLIAIVPITMASARTVTVDVMSSALSIDNE
jgi:hypothetical protein